MHIICSKVYVNSYQYVDEVRIFETFLLPEFQYFPVAVGLSLIVQATAHLFVTSTTDNLFHHYR